jgi:ornithine decarboxylase
MCLLDIGGGFPGSYSVSVDFKNIASEIRTALAANFTGVDGLEIMAEPGRFFANGSTSLLTKCTSVAEMPGKDGRLQYRYYLNDGLYASFNCVVYDHQECQMEVLEDHTRISGNPKETYCSTVFGPTCDGFDTILRDVQLPAMQEGSWVLWRGMGAYTVAAGSEFNGFERPVSFYYQLR